MVDILDQNCCLIDGPTTGVTRQLINLSNIHTYCMGKGSFEFSFESKIFTISLRHAEARNARTQPSTKFLLDPSPRNSKEAATGKWSDMCHAQGKVSPS